MVIYFIYISVYMLIPDSEFIPSQGWDLGLTFEPPGPWEQSFAGTVGPGVPFPYFLVTQSVKNLPAMQDMT